MNDLLAEGLNAYIGFQQQLASLQAEIQRDISLVKKSVRKDKELVPALAWLRRFRWYARCLGDAFAWQVFLFDRKAIAALMSGTRQPVAEQTHSTAAVFVMAGHLLSRQFGVPIVHDITNWLRIGDITFLRFDDSGKRLSWRFQTVELKSSVGETAVEDDGSGIIHLAVSMYSNESIDESTDYDASTRHQADTAVVLPQALPEKMANRPDRRLDKQFRRLDGVKARRDMKDNAITTIDGIPNLVFRLSDRETHHWADLRRAIRCARRDGYAAFSIDNFIAYALFYRKEGVNEEHMSKFKERFVDNVQDSITTERQPENRFIMLREIPMQEKHDIDGFPIMRFFDYEIPKIAVKDLLHHRLVVTAMANFARVDYALADRGFKVAGISSEKVDAGSSYSVDVRWPTEECLRLHVPSGQVSREVERAMYEFSGLEDVIQKVSSVQTLPERFTFDEFDAAMKYQSDQN